jgi:hypothetical protein
MGHWIIILVYSYNCLIKWAEMICLLLFIHLHNQDSCKEGIFGAKISGTKTESSAWWQQRCGRGRWNAASYLNSSAFPPPPPPKSQQSFTLFGYISTSSPSNPQNWSHWDTRMWEWIWNSLLFKTYQSIQFSWGIYPNRTGKFPLRQYPMGGLNNQG